MAELLFKICTILFYGSLLLELTIWHVPSIASSRGILSSEKDVVDVYSGSHKEKFSLPLWNKIMLYIIPLIFIYIAYVYPLQTLFNFRFGANPLFNVNELLIYFSCLCIIIGRVVSLSSVWSIRKNNDQKGDSFELHTDGMFNRMRNPGLVGLYTCFIGFWLSIPQPFFLICIIIYIFYMHHKVLMEENFLSNKFGNPYIDYFENTKRYV